MQMYTRPLEKLTSNTASLKIIIIKAIYDTAFIHRKICPGDLFLQFDLMTDSPPPLPCSPRQPRPHRTRKEGIKPRRGQKLPQLSPTGATTATMPQEKAKQYSKGKRHCRAEHTGGPGEPLAATWGRAGLFYQSPSNRHWRAGSPRARGSGQPAHPKALQSHTLAHAPGAAPRAAASDFQRFSRTSSENFTKPRTQDQFLSARVPWRGWRSPAGIRAQGATNTLCDQLPLPQSPLVS